MPKIIGVWKKWLSRSALLVAVFLTAGGDVALAQGGPPAGGGPPGGVGGNPATYSLPQNANTADLGALIAPRTGVATITVAPTGVVTVPTTITRTQNSDTPITFQIACSAGSGGACTTATLSITAVSPTTGRLQTLQNFVLCPGPGSSANLQLNGGTGCVQGVGESLAVQISGGKEVTDTLQLGLNVPVAASGPSGSSIASYTLSINDSNRSGEVRATTDRAISITKTQNLVFGGVVRPRSGTNTITVSAPSGSRSISGAGNGALGSGVGQNASFSVTGEPNRTFSVVTRDTASAQAGKMTLTRQDGPETLIVTLSAPATGQVGANGEVLFGVGGQIDVTSTTVLGTYLGTFLTTVQYE